MKQFLKDNFALVAAIALPLLLALIFMISTLFTRVTVADPQHDFLIATNYYDNNSVFIFSVVREKLVVSYRPQVKHENGYYTPTNVPRLWRVHVPDMKVEEIALQEPASKRAGDITIPGATDIRIQNIQPGPDGYLYSDNYSYSGNIMTELFASGRSRSVSGIVKDGRMIKIRVPVAAGWEYNTRFLGWVTDQP